LLLEKGKPRRTGGRKARGPEERPDSPAAEGKKANALLLGKLLPSNIPQAKPFRGAVF